MSAGAFIQYRDSPGMICAWVLAMLPYAWEKTLPKEAPSLPAIPCPAAAPPARQN